MTGQRAFAQAVDRRAFLVSAGAVGGGLAIGLVAGPADAATTKPAAAAAGAEVSPWLVINPDDTVTIRSASPEFGNGAMTQSVEYVVEELGCAWDAVRIEYASPTRDYVTYGCYSPIHPAAAFFGGRSTMIPRMRAMQQVGASARERLRIAAAARWGVPPGDVTVEQGKLAHTASARTIGFGAVAADAAKVKLPAEPKIRTPAEWRTVGTHGKLTTPSIVAGAAVYGIDVKLPGMVHAALLQSPVHGGRLRHYDADAVMGMPGVLAVVTIDPGEPRGVAMLSQAPYGYALTAVRAGVAVIADHWWQAQQALARLPVEWDDGPGAAWPTTEDLYGAAIAALDGTARVRVEKKSGDVGAAKGAARKVETTYLTPYCDQAPMEPLNGTALVTDDSVEIWHPAQNSQQAFWVASDEAGIVPERVVFHQTLVGGAFGRRLESDDVRVVVAVAKKFPGRPVKLIWSREEMTRQGKYRPMMACKMSAALDDTTGLPTTFAARQASRGHYPRFADTPLLMGLIPNVQVDARELPFHVTPGPYRGPGYNSYTFFQEGFIDECAVAAGIDPVEYRRRLFKDWPNPGWLKSLEDVAKQANWGQRFERGRGQGIALTGWGLNGQARGGTCVAVVATVAVSREGELKVERIDASFDCGSVVNRKSAENLIQGGLIFGTNTAVNEEMTVAGSRMVEGNFDTYPIIRINEAPEVHVHFGGLSGEPRYAELGEPPVGAVGPAIGNAIFAACGVRVRRQPFRKQDLRWS